MNKSWSEIFTDVLPGRINKPRISGLTMVIDTGLPLSYMRDLLQMGAGHIDFWKFGFASAAVCPREVMESKVSLCQEYGVLAYPGGTSLEIAVTQGIWELYLQRLWDGGIRVVEVSDGTMEMSSRLRRELIKTARKMGFTVLTEVGKKREGYFLPVEAMAQSIQADLSAGAQYVIVEGREGGKSIGMYDSEGRVREDEVDALVRLLGPQSTRLIWEAPLASQQTFYIGKFGNKVNFGNIKPAEIVALEALRRGFRSDTFRMMLPSVEEPQQVEKSGTTGLALHIPDNVVDLPGTKPTLWTEARTKGSFSSTHAHRPRRPLP